MKGILDEAAEQIFLELFEPKLARLRAEIELLKAENKFIRYPKGLEEYLSISYDQAYALWKDNSFPRANRKCGNINIKGVYSHDLERFLKEKRR